MKNMLGALCVLLCCICQSASVSATVVRYVKPGGVGDGSSWANASGDLQAMINNADAGDQVWMTAGSYFPSRKADNSGTITPRNRDNAFVLKSNVGIYGGFRGNEISLKDRDWRRNRTILSGDFDQDDSVSNAENARHVVIAAGVFDAVLDGLIIRGGNADAAGESLVVNGKTIYGGQGGGIYYGACAPAIFNCEIRENVATTGAGVYVFYNEADLSAVTVRYKQISNSKLCNNSAVSGGGVYNGSDGAVPTTGILMTNCAVFGNSGGGIANYLSQGKFINCTIAYNSGHGIRNERVTIAVYNTIFWGNSSGDMNSYLDYYNFATVSSCMTQYACDYPGSGYFVVNVYPEFKNTEQEDYRPGDGVGAVMFGDVSLYIPVNGSVEQDVDLAGKPRLVGGGIDIGAYERQPHADWYGRLFVRAGNTGFQWGNSWGSALGELADALLLAKDDNDIKEIWVAAGTYHPKYRPDNLKGSATLTDQVYAFLIPGNVRIYGGFTGTEDSLEQRPYGGAETILSGDNWDNDKGSDNWSENAMHVVVTSPKTTGALLNGVTIRSGHAVSGLDSIWVDSVSVTHTAGAGVYMAGGKLTLSDVILHTNEANAGAAVYAKGADLTLNSCVVVNNVADNVAGSVYAVQTDLSLVNCTVAGNSSGGVYTNPQGTAAVATYVYNSIIWGNRLHWSLSGYEPAFKVRNSLLELFPADSTNLSGTINPLFVNPDKGDFRLSGGSPCINKGSNLLWSEAVQFAGDDRDVRLKHRVINEVIDMGAYETGLAQQMLPFEPEITKTYGDLPFSPGFGTTAGTPVFYKVQNSAIAEITGSNALDWSVNIKKAGVTQIAISSPGDAYFEQIADTLIGLTVRPAILNVAAEPKTKVYKTADPVLTYTATGLVHDDIKEAVLWASLKRDTGENAGTYAILADLSLLDSNYRLDYHSNTFTIQKAKAGAIKWSQDLSAGCDAGNVDRLGLYATANGDPKGVRFSVGDTNIAVVSSDNMLYLKSPGITTIRAFADTLNYTGADTVRVLNFKSSALQIKRHWTDVLFIDSPAAYQGFQWLSGDWPIEGADRPYYTFKDGGIFSIRVKTADKTVEACPAQFYPQDFASPAFFASPNPVAPGATLTFSLNYKDYELVGAQVLIRDLEGRIWGSVAFKFYSDITLNAPEKQGIYIAELLLKDGRAERLSVLVK